MMRERSMFLHLKPHEEGAIAFGGIGKGKIFGMGKIDIPSLAFLNNVLYVKGLQYNLLSISQFCDSGCIVCFKKVGIAMTRWQLIAYLHFLNVLIYF